MNAVNRLLWWSRKRGLLKQRAKHRSPLVAMLCKNGQRRTMTCTKAITHKLSEITSAFSFKTLHCDMILIVPPNVHVRTRSSCAKLSTGIFNNLAAIFDKETCRSWCWTHAAWINWVNRFNHATKKLKLRLASQNKTARWHTRNRRFIMWLLHVDLSYK